MSAAEPTMSSASPFDRIRGRFLMGWLIAAMVLSVVITDGLWRGVDQSDHPAGTATFALSLSCLLMTGSVIRARLAGVSVRAAYAGLPPREAARLCLLAVPMLGLGFVTMYLFFAPLSLIAPGLAQTLLFEGAPVLYSATPPYPLGGNVLSFVAVVLAAPVAEEWFFRGLLFRRWSHKWGPVQGVMSSSIAFALLHVDPLGSLAFGAFMCALHARYGSLWAPTIVHAGNNALGWGLAALDAHGGIPVAVDTLGQLRAAWWLPLGGLVLVLPWALRFRSRYGAMSSWIVADGATGVGLRSRISSSPPPAAS